MSESVNIWTKLQEMRCALQDMCIKKSGKNTYAGYSYYELGDFLPPINNLLAEFKCATLVRFSNDVATLTLVNCEKPEEVIEFTSPMAEATLKGAHAIQNLGAVETYQRRYLYMTAFEIVESDVLDNTQGKQESSKPALSEKTRKELNKLIAEYKKATGLNGVSQKLESSIGKPLSDVTESDAKQIKILLADWLNKAKKRAVREELEGSINE